MKLFTDNFVFLLFFFSSASKQCIFGNDVDGFLMDLCVWLKMLNAEIKKMLVPMLHQFEGRNVSTFSRFKIGNSSSKIRGLRFEFEN